MSEVVNIMNMPLEPNAIKNLEAKINDDLIKNNKYGKGKKDYLDIGVFKRLMNTIFGYKWSWEVIKHEIVDAKFVYVMGRLSVPGIGIKEAFGAAKLDQTDNSQQISVANSNAFKAACKLLGVGQSLLDDGFEDELFEEDDTPPPAKAKTKTKATFTEKQIKAMITLKEAYSITDNSELLKFLKVWNKSFTSMNQLNGDNVDAFLEYVEENPEDFEDLKG